MYMSENLLNNQTIPEAKLENKQQFILDKTLLIGLVLTFICIVTASLSGGDRIVRNLNKIADEGVIVASIVILPLLIIIYFYAYNFYKDRFFFLVALSWLHNLFYMIFIEGLNSEELTSDLKLKLKLIQVLLSFSSDFYLFLAVTASNNTSLKIRNILFPSSLFALWFLIYKINIIPIEQKINYLFLIAPMYAFYVLFITGRSIEQKFEPSLYSNILKFTFVFYAFLQLTFLLKSGVLNFLFNIIAADEKTFFNRVNWLSILFKSANGLALLFLLRNGFAKLVSDKKLAEVNLASAKDLVEETKHKMKLQEKIVEETKHNMELKQKLVDETNDRIRLQNDTISLQKELLESERLRNEDKISHLNEFADLGVLTASIEHELRNPLSVINTSLILMREEFQSEKEILKHLDDLDKEIRSIQAATDIVNTLRSNKEDLNTKMREIDVEAFINRIIKNVKKEFGEKINHVYFKINKQKEELFVTGFPFLLEKIFINFSKNAVESILSKDDKGVINYDLTVETKDTVTITITDNGPGFLDLEQNKIPDENLHIIIRPTYSTKFNANSKANRGIGLFVCNKIIKLHKGKMKFETPKNGGARISVTLDRYFTNKMKKKDRMDTE